MDQWRVDQLTEADLLVPLDDIEFTEEETLYAADALSLLGDRDFDIINLYYIRRVPQARVAVLLGLSQADISYRILRAVGMLKVKQAPDYQVLKAYFDQGAIEMTEFDMKVLDSFLVLRNQQDVAIDCGVSQSTVSKRLRRIQSLLKTFNIKLIRGLDD